MVVSLKTMLPLNRRWVLVHASPPSSFSHGRASTEGTSLKEGGKCGTTSAARQIRGAQLARFARFARFAREEPAVVMLGTEANGWASSSPCPTSSTETRDAAAASV